MLKAIGTILLGYMYVTYLLLITILAIYVDI